MKLKRSAAIIMISGVLAATLATGAQAASASGTRWCSSPTPYGWVWGSVSGGSGTYVKAPGESAATYYGPGSYSRGGPTGGGAWSVNTDGTLNSVSTNCRNYT